MMVNIDFEQNRRPAFQSAVVEFGGSALIARPFVPPLATFFFAMFTFAQAPVMAQDAIASSVVKTANAPVTMTACHIGPNYYNAHVNLVNRTRYDAITMTVAFRFFDDSNAQIGQATNMLSPNELLHPDDTGTYETDPSPSLSEPGNAIARVSCRVISATFTGRKTWSYPRRWPEKLRPMTAPDAGGADKDGSDNRSTSQSQLPSGSRSVNLPIQVTNAWNDTLNDALFIHDTLVITGGNSDVTLAPSSFALAMNLVNGGRKSYPALSTPAPSYSKFNVMANNGAGGNVMVSEVDPSSDLGRLGSITVPAHGSATVTLTFAVTDPVVDPKANRNVTLR